MAREPVYACDYPGCLATLPGLSKWDQIKAAGKGWFFERLGLSWCPEHNPEWVAEWRAKKAAEKAAEKAQLPPT